MRYTCWQIVGHDATLTAFQISKHIAHLVDSLTDLAGSKPAPIDPMPVLEKCVQLLEVLRSRDNLQPTDLHRLEDSIKEDKEA